MTPQDQTQPIGSPDEMPDPAATAAVPPTASIPSTPPTPPTPMASTPKESAARRPQGEGASVTTIVWGLVLVVVGVGIASLGLGARFDLDLALVVVLGGSGVALLVGAVWSNWRRRSAADRAVAGPADR